MDFWLAMVLSFLPADAPVWLVGENDAGIKSWKKRLKRDFGSVHKASIMLATVVCLGLLNH